MPLNAAKARLLAYFDRVLPSLWLLLVAGILYAGLRPFQLAPRNGVQWRSGESGISFDGHGMVYSEKSFQEIAQGGATSGDKAITIEIVARAHLPNPSQRSHILSDHSDHGTGGFLLAQYGSELLLQSSFLGVGGARGGFRELDVPGVFQAGEWVFIAITSGPADTIIYIDGRPQEIYRSRILDTNKLTGRLLLGSCGDGNESWEGDVRELAFYSESLSQQQIQQHWAQRRLNAASPLDHATALYLFAADPEGVVANEVSGGQLLLVPRHLRLFRHDVLRWDLRFTRDGMLDVALNILGFVPFGAFTAAFGRRRLRWSRNRTMAATLAATLVLTLAIELTQVYLPGRDSSSVDVLMNFSGGMAGAWLWFRFSETLRSKQYSADTTLR